jgi:hypothetical protein
MANDPVLPEWIKSGLDQHFKEIVIPFGGGGTDGGQLARKGIETVSKLFYI